MIAARTSASTAGLLDWLPARVTATAAAHAATAAVESAKSTPRFSERRRGGPLLVLIVKDSIMPGDLEGTNRFQEEAPLHRN
jgi:hypothetical protein